MNLYWLEWTIIGFGPSVILIYFGIRACVHRTDISRLAYIAGEIVSAWIMPALAVLATIPLSSGTNIPPLIITLLVSGQFLINSFLRYILRLCVWQTENENHKFRVKQYILWSLDFMVPSLAMAIAMIIRTSAGGRLFRGYPDLDLFLLMVGASYITSGITHNFGFKGYKMLRLAPCELYYSAMRIAQIFGRKVTEVRILKDMPFRFINAMAYAGEGVLLSEDLINNLTKKEVDAVIAHEIGHIADEKLWNLGTLFWLVLMLIYIGLSAVFTKLIISLPGNLFFLHYINWMSLFLVPHLINLKYCRWRESIAENNVKGLDSPEAIISADYKLYALENYPLDSPWWWNIISSHPAPKDRFKTAARLYNLSGADIECITARAESELREPSADRYEIVCVEETEVPALKRQYKGWHKAVVVTVSIILGIGALIGFPLAGSSINDTYLAIGVVVGMVTCGVAMLLPIHLYENAVTRAYRKALLSALQEKYPDTSLSELQLVTATFFGDYDKRKRQGALLGVREDKLLLLGESASVEIPIASITSVARWTDPKSHFSSSVCVVVSYMLDDMQQWVLLLPMSGAKKGEPRSSRQLERYTKNLLLKVGMENAQRKKKPIPLRVIAVRLPLAVLMLFAILGIVEIVSRLMGNRPFEQQWAFVWIGSIAVPALWAWVVRSSTTKTDRPKDE